MTDKKEPYISRSPGNLITAEDWNEVQVQIKLDIENQVNVVQVALDEFKQVPVDADTFGGKTPDEWDQRYDERYVNHSELGAGWGEYRRYFKQIDRQITIGDTTGYEPAIIEHNLDRYPLVSVFELAELGLQDSDVLGQGTDPAKVRFLVYYAGHRDPAAELLMTRGSDDVHWGDPLTVIMDQFGMTTSPTQLFDDVLNDLWAKMFDPGLGQDHFKRASYGHSKYIQEQVLDKNKTVENLHSAGMWEDLHMAIRPQIMPIGPWSVDPGPDSPYVQVFHLSQNMLEIRVRKEMDLMVLLRT